jgi:prevent-host-death family protein
MRSASISEAKNRLSALVDRVRAGESIVILDRGTPVARLEPIARTGASEGRLQRLERAGLIRPGLTAPAVDVVRVPGPQVRASASAVAALLDERRSGR